MTAPQILATRVDADGTQTAQASSTPCSDQSGCEMHVLPLRTIPIVFIPGIMGSNLRLTKERTAELKKSMGKDNDISWRPEATMETLAMIAKTPAQRQLILDPEATSVDRYDLSVAGADKRHANVADVAYVRAEDKQDLAAKERDQYARKRGWSEVFFQSYGKLLQTLEASLNQMCMDGRAQSGWTNGPRHALNVEPKDWGGNGGAALTEAELQTVSDAWYPVHAIGYNWLRSNAESAKDVAQRIREIIKYYQDLKFDCSKVIVVTHSMGGLVGRALVHPEYGNAQDVIAGIVHGAMPAVGAAAGYKRIRVGFEGSGMVGSIFKKIVGDTGPKVTAVLANAPGGLQLLPSERYGTDWLKVSLDGKEVLSLPKADPYEEIYTVQDKWYRLITPEWVNPAEQKNSSVKNTMVALWDARKFHQSIAETYHPQTYLSYGADDKQKAWGELVWKTGKAPFLRGGAGQLLGLQKLHITGSAENWQTISDSGEGEIILKDGAAEHDGQQFGAHIADPAHLGDGTVPAERSAQDPVRQGKAQIAYQQTGYEHQDSYGNDKVLASTTHAICKIALQAFAWNTH